MNLHDIQGRNDGPGILETSLPCLAQRRADCKGDDHVVRALAKQSVGTLRRVEMGSKLSDPFHCNKVRGWGKLWGICIPCTETSWSGRRGL